MELLLSELGKRIDPKFVEDESLEYRPAFGRYDFTKLHYEDPNNRQEKKWNLDLGMIDGIKTVIHLNVYALVDDDQERGLLPILIEAVVHGRCIPQAELPKDLYEPLEVVADFNKKVPLVLAFIERVKDFIQKKRNQAKHSSRKTKR